jgi:hypothetical protein
MQKLVVPETVIRQLEKLGQEVQICDSSGRTIGLFLPEVDLSAFEVVGEDLSAEELRQIANSTEWHTTAEVLRRLESLQ